jgi:FMN phosphatase YigB (HAD superfamily)
MAGEAPLIFLVDVDNTLLDNDAAKRDIGAQIEGAVGPQRAARFWELYEQVRAENGYVDFPAAVSRLAQEDGGAETEEALMRLLNSFPYRRYLYPHALDTLTYLNGLGEAVVLSDGDPTFQRHKIDVSGISRAVEGRVMVVVHKEEELDKVFHAYPARHYAAIDDKPRIVSALERYCPTTFTTVLVEQGKYAEECEYRPPPDITVPTIADVRNITRAEFLSPHPPAGSAD